ncbi:MAG: LysM peptidoglycan-binding domain-containing protein [Nitrosomonadales bacterium]|nr:LysM peptidoglycan-binding domain-containing protein [Nitrosomonadales bacterium]
MRKIISLICFLLPILACADQLQIRTDSSQDIRPDAPDRYTVVKGDTLWDISSKFFKDPWKWPHIWGLNKDTIKDPHWIYPGDVVNLDRTNGTLRIGQTDTSQPSVTGGTAIAQDTGTSSDTRNVVKLSPKVHEVQSTHDAIPSIPASVIGPFLSQPLVIEEGALKDAPTLIGAREGRVVLGKFDTGFARGLTADKGDKWQIYRPGKKFVDPETDEKLGVEAVYLGEAEVKAFAEVSTISITHSVQEAYQGDLLVAPSIDTSGPYLPRAPETNISARVISVYGGVSQAGQNTAIVLNKGARDGLEVGHVLALYRKGEVIKEKSKSFFSWDKAYTLPDERYGLVFVFRVFNKVSYALVMQTKLPVQLLDRAQTP